MNVGKTGYFAVGLYWAYSDPGRPKIRLNNKLLIKTVNVRLN